jgi:hypothetical protein
MCPDRLPVNVVRAVVDIDATVGRNTMTALPDTAVTTAIDDGTRAPQRRLVQAIGALSPHGVVPADVVGALAQTTGWPVPGCC